MFSTLQKKMRLAILGGRLVFYSELTVADSYSKSMLCPLQEPEFPLPSLPRRQPGLPSAQLHRFDHGVIIY